MLGPLKFGIQPPSVKAAAPSRFALTLSLEGGIINTVLLGGPTGATAFIDWGNGTSSSIVFTGGGYNTYNHSCGTTATISGSNLTSLIRLTQISSNNKIKSITGTYPTSLITLGLGFNYADPVFTPPNISTLYFYGSSGPSNLTTGSNLISLQTPPSNLSRLDLTASTKLTTLPELPVGLINLTTPPGITGITGLPDSLTDLDLYVSTKLTTLPTLPPGLTYLRTPPGLIRLPALPVSLAILDTFYSTKLTSISISIPGNTNLYYLIIPLTCKSLDVSGCTGLSSLSLSPVLTTLDISNCTALTSIPDLPPVLTNLRIDNSGLTSLDLTKTNVTTLNIPPEMYSQLRTLNVAGSKLKLSGLLKYQVPSGSNWSLY